MKTSTLLYTAVALFLFANCNQQGETREIEQGEWTILFDGETFDGWRGFQREDIPDGWQTTAEGDIHFTHTDGDINTGIISTNQFGSFEFEFEWRIAPQGNSGVFFHVTEDEDAIWKTGPEYQIVDNVNHPDGDDPLTAAGANYALHGPDEDFTRPLAEYNAARIIVRGSNVQHWLNGQLVVDYELGSAEWEQRVAQTGFADHPLYGKTSSGHISLQEGGPVWYRNLRIRELGE